MPDLTYKQLAKAVQDVAKDSMRSAEAIREHAERISQHARDTARIADQIGARRVDQATIGETQQLSKIMDGLTEAAIKYASAADTTAKQAQAAHAANRTSHERINEAAGRSPVGAEIYDVHNRWFEQE